MIGPEDGRVGHLHGNDSRPTLSAIGPGKGKLGGGKKKQQQQQQQQENREHTRTSIKGRPKGNESASSFDRQLKIWGQLEKNEPFPKREREREREQKKTPKLNWPNPVNSARATDDSDGNRCGQKTARPDNETEKVADDDDENKTTKTSSRNHNGDGQSIEPDHRCCLVFVLVCFGLFFVCWGHGKVDGMNMSPGVSVAATRRLMYSAPNLTRT